MDDSSTNYLALNGASKNAQKAFDAAFSNEYIHVPEDEKKAWAMSAIIHCDICRHVVAFDECKVEGLARLLFIADITSKLFETQRWYFGTGAGLLKRIAKSKGVSEKNVTDALKVLSSKYKIGKAQSHANFRNKFAYHYDENALSYLKKFGEEDANNFHELLIGFVKYSADWARFTKDLIQGGKVA